MTATERVAAQAAAMAAGIEANLAAVRAEYKTLESATRLMRRVDAANIEEAFRLEARQRYLRNQWAKTTS